MMDRIMSPVLETERLAFGLWRPEDLPLALELWGDPEVTAFIDSRGRLTPEQVRARLEQEIAMFGQSGVQYWPIFEKSTGGFVGCCGLKPWVHSPRGGLEFGFHLKKTHWGKGFALEAGQGVIHHARDALGRNRLMAGHHPDNHKAKKILTKLGFTFVELVLYKPTGLMHPSYELELACSLLQPPHGSGDPHSN
jgi:ribosomal-protein-alanine N-acetyltransferase